MTAFIFDMDGTLLDSIKIWHEAEESVTKAAGIQLTKEERDDLNALTLEEAGAFFHERFGLMDSPQAIVDTILDYMLKFYRNSVEPNPGAVDFVRSVYESGSPLCVLSSSPQSFLQAGLTRTGLKRYFRDDLIISAEDLGLVKRDPKTFERVCSMLDVAPGDAWLFDDSWYALATAQSVGLHNVGVFSVDECGTHEELARYAEKVVDDFTPLTLADFL